MRRVFVLFALLVLAGCGTTTTVTRVETSVEKCNGIAADLSIHYAICDGHRFVRDGERIPISDPPGAKVGHWAKAFLSPDRKTFLAQWSAECEVPIAFFVTVEGGMPSVVTGESDWTDAPVSIADGWTKDGRAIVEFPAAACGSGIHKPGIYFVALDGTRTFVQPLKRTVGP